MSNEKNTQKLTRNQKYYWRLQGSIQLVCNKSWEADLDDVAREINNQRYLRLTLKLRRN